MEVGRLAFRHEGEWWNAYWARSQHSMADAIHLGSIRMSVVEGKPEVKDAFMRLMRLAFDRTVKDVTGQKPTWSEPVRGPESERSGHG
jgi:hypothetical protein